MKGTGETDRIPPALFSKRCTGDTTSVISAAPPTGG